MEVRPDARTTIVFVDDEPNVLDGLRRATRRFRDRWDTHFADDAEAALDLIAGLPRVDAVVSDMRMPGVDGAGLLCRVRDRWPTAARIILSGQSDHEAVFRAIGPAHQYLAKPCDVEALAGVVDRLTTPPRSEVGEPVRSAIGRVDRLPAQPAQFRRLTEQLESPTARLADVAAVIADDVALTAEILRVVNSAFFGVSGTVETVESAVSLLGVDVVRGIVIGCELFDTAHVGWLDVAALGARSRAVASAARGLALRRGASHSVGASAFLAGMVSELGLLVAAGLDAGSDLARAVNHPAVGPTDLAPETAAFGADRFQVGGLLLRLWGFAPPIVEAVCVLATGRVDDRDVLAWSLVSARRLVIEAGIDAAALADPHGAVPELDQVLAR